jgi:FkbM family methyltransferase
MADGDSEVIVETLLTGARFFARPSTMIELSLIEHRNWEFLIQLRMLNRMGRSGTFVDGGANIGVHACAVARRLGDAGRVLAIEPIPWLADRLERNRDLNGLPNLQIVRQAVGAKKEMRPFFVPDADEYNWGEATFYRYKAGLRRQIEVTVRPLDEILAEARCDDVRVIKLDVEGAELEALNGARQTLRRWRPHLFLEYNRDAWAEAGATLTDLRDLLTAEYGYELQTLPGGNEQVYMIEAIPPEPKRTRLHWPRRRP